MPGATVQAWGGATLTVTVDDVDVSCDVVRLVVDRSKNRLWDAADAGTCLIALNLEAGGVDASTGPIGAPVVVHVAYGPVGRNLFTGTVQLRRLTAVVDGDVLTLECVDGFERIGRVNVRADDGDPTHGASDTVEMRIARWLDVADWSATDRAFGSSAYTCPATLIDGNALLQIQAATLADGGEFFIDGDGVATFLAWNWRVGTGPVAAVYSDRRAHDWVPYTSAELRDDLDEVQNQVAGVRRSTGPTDVPVVQTVTNTGSVTTYGPRGDSLDNLELEDDTQVADRVTALVAIAGMPSPRFDAITVQPAFDPERMWPRVIPCTFGSLVAANRLWPDGTEQAYYGHVLGEVWTFTADDAAVTWRVSGTGSWDAHSPPRPPICVEVTPGGFVRVCPGTPCDDTSEVIFRDCVDGSPIGDPLPPGSLCGDGVAIPEGACQVCYVNDYGESCVDLPTDNPVLWFDALEPGPHLLIERIDGDAVAGLAGFDHTELDVIPGGYDAIWATEAGGPIGTSLSDHVIAASWDGGWTVKFWFYDTTGLDPTTYLIDLGNIVISASKDYGDLTVTQLEAIVVDGSAITHLSGPLADVDTATWQLWAISWTSASGGQLSIYRDGILLDTNPFPYTPADLDGNWLVRLGFGQGIGEVKVYAETIVPEIPPYVGDFIRVDQAGVTAGGPGSYYWLVRDVASPGAGPGATIATMDCRLLCRFDPAERVYLMSTDEASSIMWQLYTDGAGAFALGWMVTWSPFTPDSLTPTIPSDITADSWVWIRVELNAAHDLSLQYSLDHLNPNPTDWTVIDTASSVSIPVRPTFGDGYPFAVGEQVSGATAATGHLDVRRIFQQFNTDPSDLATFEVDPAVVDTLQRTVTADTTNGHDYVASLNLPITVETE